MKVIKEHDIIKVNNELLHVLKASNNGSYLCKNSKGRLVWAAYTQKIMHSKFYKGLFLTAPGSWNSSGTCPGLRI